MIAGGDAAGSDEEDDRVGVEDARRVMHAIAREVEAEHPDLAALLREKPLAAQAAPDARREGAELAAHDRQTGVAALPVARMDAAAPRDAVVNFVESMDLHADVSLLVDAYSAFLAKFGLTGFAVVDPYPVPHPAKGAVWASTWEEARLCYWTEREHLAVNPVVRQLRLVNGPLRWSVAAGAAGEEGRRFVEVACGNGMSDGMAIPLHGRSGVFVFIAMGGPNYDLDRTEELNLHLASVYFHARLERLRDGLRGRGGRNRLTPRERECLSWVAAGKTDWEISQILSIAEQTVHEYVQNALTKMNVTTRAQAVATAMFNKDILF